MEEEEVEEVREATLNRVFDDNYADKHQMKCDVKGQTNKRKHGLNWFNSFQDWHLPSEDYET